MSADCPPVARHDYLALFDLPDGCDPARFEPVARAALAAWQECWGDAYERLERLVPLDLQPKAEMLLEMAGANGVRHWAERCLRARPAFADVAALRRWCLFQYQVLREIDDHPQQWDCSRDGRAVYWRESLVLAAPLFFTWKPEPEGDALHQWVNDLCQVRPLRRGYVNDLVPRSTYQQLVRNLWDVMRVLGSAWPDEPNDVHSQHYCSRALAQVVLWCDAQAALRSVAAETPAPQDGPADEADAAEEAAAQAKVEWSEPDSPLQWAQVFGLSYKTMKTWLDNQVIRNQQLSPRRYRIAKDELPGA